MGKVTTINAADLFCGAGGTSSGLVKACQALGINLDLLAINHWDIAIKTHTANHPNARHMCESLDMVDPRKAIPSGTKLDLLWASPECTHHSVARGGKPINDQSRASAWHVVRWAEALMPNNIMVENVKEFLDWAPIGSNDRPLKSKKGEVFRAWKQALESLGYTVGYRILNAADYGDATSRERLFVQARRGRRQLSWPEPTHSKTGGYDVFGERKKWVAAREIIDWSISSPSIFRRKRKLSPNTLKRIEVGLRKFNPAVAEPFLVVLRQHADARSIDGPLPTITAGGQHIGLCQPFLIGAGGAEGAARPKSVDDPLNTVLTNNRIGVCQPFIVPQFKQQGPRSVDNPLGTVTTTSRGVGLVEPFLVQVNHATEDSSMGSRCKDLDEPLPAMTCRNGLGVCEPFLLPHPRPSEKERVESIDDPMRTITATSSDFCLVEPYLVKFYGTAGAVSVNEPLDTITAKDRFGLVEIGNEKYYLDIRFRMLQPHELAKAMGFDENYQFQGTREKVVKQIGNAVPVNLAQALCAEILRTEPTIMRLVA